MINLLQEKWEEIKNSFITDYDVADVSYNTWIKPMEVFSAEGDQVYILVNTMSNSNYAIDYISRKYKQILEVIIERKTNFHLNVHFITPEEAARGDISNNNRKNVTPELDSYYNAVMNANLNPKYTFETFVVGSNNSFAHAAALAVAESPGTQYNPLFIYGGVGLGKTHLMQSIAHFILKKNKNMKVLYVTSEKFTNELIEALRTKKTMDFKEKYRNIDVLLIDDIQFIIGKESTQEEFFHTFNVLYENGKQVVISSDKPPKDFTNLEDRLRSRFSVGLPVDISSPDYETRMAILRKKQETENIKIPDEIMKYIATNVNSNIRALEGALNKVVAYSKLSNNPMTLETAEEILKDLINDHKENAVTIPYIIEVISDHFGFQVEELTSQKRNKEIAYPRQIAMYLCRKMTDFSLQQIGKELGNRDHTTIRHGIEKITDDLKTNPSLQQTIDTLKKKISPSS